VHTLRVYPINFRPIILIDGNGNNKGTRPHTKFLLGALHFDIAIGLPVIAFHLKTMLTFFMTHLGPRVLHFKNQTFYVFRAAAIEIL
jgi:hypothetical protein